VPIRYIWHREIGLCFDPDRRIQDVVRPPAGAAAA
jgi:hypothetical protein